MWYLYILECADNTLYTGVTTDVARRFAEHQAGVGAKYTRAHKAVKLLYTEEYDSKSTAHRREAEIKRWRRGKKLELIKSR
jgi:putative endonuclease